MSKDTISVNMNIYDIPILVEQLEKANKEIKRLKEEYVMLQNASDEVEEEKDKEIDRLNNIINKAIEYIENEMPCLWEVDDVWEDINGNYQHNYKEYDNQILLNKLKGSDK